MRHDIVIRVFWLLTIIILGACPMFGWAMQG